TWAPCASPRPSKPSSPGPTAGRRWRPRRPAEQRAERAVETPTYRAWDRLTRRAFVLGAGAGGLGLLAGCGRLPWQAPPAKVPRIGFLSPRPLSVSLDRLVPFR